MEVRAGKSFEGDRGRLLDVVGSAVAVIDSIATEGWKTKKFRKRGINRAESQGKT